MGETLDKPQATADALGANDDTFDLTPPREKETKVAMAVPRPAPVVRQEQPQQQQNPWDADPIFAGAYKIISPGEGAHGDPNAKNPYSSATGLVQITRPTFLSTFKKHHPEESQGKSDDEIWALARDGNTNTRVGAELAHDNAIQMQRAGVAVSPTTIAAAHRIGAGGTIGALKADPNTPLSQVAPDVLSRGNEDIASMTVGQFLQNPYPGRHGGRETPGDPAGPAPGALAGDPAALFRINQNAEQGNRMLADLNKNLAEDRERISKLAKDYKPFDPTPPPKQPDVDPLQAFGSVAGLFGLLAAGLSRTPGIAAMNAMAGAIEGAQQHDWKKYQTEYRAWKDNTDYAIQAHKIYSDDLNEALRMMSTDATTGHSMLQLTLAKNGDYENQMRQWREDPLKFQELAANSEKARIQLEGMRETADLHIQLKAANLNLEKNREAVDAAHSTGDPQQIKTAEDNYKKAQELVDERLEAIEKLKRAEMGGYGRGSASGVTDERRRLTAQAMKEHPEWKADQIVPWVEEQMNNAKKPPPPPQGAVEKESAAAQASTGMPLTQIAPGWGSNAVKERQQLRLDAVKKIMADTGMNANDAGIELANRTIEYQSGKKSSGQLTTMLGATRQAVDQLDFNIQKTKEIMATLAGSDISPVLNSLARGVEKWSGDPKYSSLFYYMHAVAMESARILSGGQASIAQLNATAAEEAQKWVNINMTPESFTAPDGVGNAMMEEGAKRIETYIEALKKQRVGGAVTPGVGAPAASPDTAAPAQSPSTPTPPQSLSGLTSLQWSPTRKQWRDKDSGKIYNQDGSEAP